MKVLCDCPEIVDDVPGEYADYLRMFGPDGVRSCQYQKYKLDRVIGKPSVQEDLSEKVLSTFEIGARYTRKDIKFMLTKIYSECGETDTAKATDIQRWFGVKDCPIQREPAYEIIGKVC